MQSKQIPHCCSTRNERACDRAANHRSGRRHLQPERGIPAHHIAATNKNSSFREKSCYRLMAPEHIGHPTWQTPHCCNNYRDEQPIRSGSHRDSAASDKDRLSAGKLANKQSCCHNHLPSNHPKDDRPCPRTTTAPNPSEDKSDSAVDQDGYREARGASKSRPWWCSRVSSKKQWQATVSPGETLRQPETTEAISKKQPKSFSENNTSRQQKPVNGGWQCTRRRQKQTPMTTHVSPTRKQNQHSSTQTSARADNEGLSVPSDGGRLDDSANEIIKSTGALEKVERSIYGLANQPGNRSHQIDKPGRKPAIGPMMEQPVPKPFGNPTTSPKECHQITSQFRARSFRVPTSET